VRIGRSEIVSLFYAPGYELLPEEEVDFLEELLSDFVFDSCLARD
jgi:hypothetical protein